MTDREVVVTGLGVVVDAGIGLDDLWRAVVEPADGPTHALLGPVAPPDDVSMHHGLIPPVAADLEADPEVTLDVVHGEARPWTPGPVLSNSFGLGGTNGCLVLAP